MASAGMTMSPMSSTAGGGGGGGGGTGFAGFFAGVGAGLRLGLRTCVAAGFLVVVAGFAGVGACATETGASRHAATRAAARFKAREDKQAWPRILRVARRPALTTLETRFDRQTQRARLHRVEMAVFDRRTFAGQLALVEICDVVVVRVEQVVGRERDREAFARADSPARG